jgi:hypothetical protein
MTNERGAEEAFAAATTLRPNLKVLSAGPFGIAPISAAFSPIAAGAGINHLGGFMLAGAPPARAAQPQANNGQPAAANAERRSGQPKASGASAGGVAAWPSGHRNTRAPLTGRTSG